MCRVPHGVSRLVVSAGAVVLGLAALSRPVWAYPVSSVSLGDLVQKAEWVGVGRVQTAKEIGQDERPEIGGTTWHTPLKVDVNEAVLQVELTLKGVPPPDGRLGFHFVTAHREPDARGLLVNWVDLERFEVGQRYVVFFRRARGNLEPVDPLAGDTIVLPDTMPLPVVAGSSALESAESLVVAIIEQGDGGLRHEALKLLGRYDASHAEDEPAPQGPRVTCRVRRGVFALPTTADRLGALLVDPDASVRVAAAQLLVWYQYLPALPVLVNEYAESMKWAGPHTVGTNLSLYGVEALWQDAAAPYLTQLARSPRTEVRKVALAALRAGGREASIPVFVAALDDSDFMNRWQSAEALGEITQQYPHALGSDTFLKREAEEIRFWKDWWQARQHARAGPGSDPRHAAP